MSNIVSDAVEFMLKYAKDANWEVMKNAMQILSDKNPLQYGLCFNETDQTRDYAEGNPRWVVTLNNGQTVYSFDHHEVKLPESSWTRLKQYCEDHALYITDMYIHFRTNSINIPSNRNGYYFRRSILASLLSDDCRHFFLVGTLENNKIEVTKYLVPPMLLETRETREIEGNEDSLIRGPNESTSSRI